MLIRTSLLISTLMFPCFSHASDGDCAKIIGKTSEVSAKGHSQSESDYVKELIEDFKMAKETGSIVWIYSFRGLLDAGDGIPSYQANAYYIADVQPSKTNDPARFSYTVREVGSPLTITITNLDYSTLRSYRLAQPKAFFKRKEPEPIDTSLLIPYALDGDSTGKNTNFISVLEHSYPKFSSDSPAYTQFKMGFLRNYGTYMSLTQYPGSSTGEMLTWRYIRSVQVYEFTSGLKTNPNPNLYAF